MRGNDINLEISKIIDLYNLLENDIGYDDGYGLDVVREINATKNMTMRLFFR